MAARGAWFGWWTFASKFNLALAAGVALPLVAQLGYTQVGAKRQPSRRWRWFTACCPAW